MVHWRNWLWNWWWNFTLICSTIFSLSLLYSSTIADQLHTVLPLTVPHLLGLIIVTPLPFTCLNNFLSSRNQFPRQLIDKKTQTRQDMSTSTVITDTREGNIEIHPRRHWYFSFSQHFTIENLHPLSFTIINPVVSSATKKELERILEIKTFALK